MNVSFDLYQIRCIYLRQYKLPKYLILSHQSTSQEPVLIRMIVECIPDLWETVVRFLIGDISFVSFTAKHAKLHAVQMKSENLQTVWDEL